MEPLPLTRVPTPSGSPKSSKKRTFSPDAPTTFKKKPKTDTGQARDKGRRRKRRRKQEKQPIAHDIGAASGITHTVPSSSLAPASPVPSVSDSQLSSDPSQSDVPFDCSSVPPVVMASSSHEKRAACTPLGKERAMSTSHSDYKSLREHELLLASLTSSLVCPICLDLLHKPFALSPCGHVSCYQCLINWFNVDQQPELEGGSIFRKKTCPHCRAVVHGRPIEAWNIKDMVATVVRSGLGRDFSQSADVNVKVAAPSGSETLPQDPWVNIFHPTMLRPGRLPVEASPDDFGMYDAEDQVYRCLDCMHEIWEGSCSQCGRRYTGHEVDAFDDNASGWPRSVGVDESDDGTYESSFIDDQDSERSHGEAVVEVSSDNDEVTRQGRENDGEAQIAFSEGSEDGDENVSDINVSPPRPPLGTRRQVISDSDADDNCGHSTSENDESPPMRSFGRLHGRRSIMLEGESVESDFSASDDGDDDGNGSGVQWSGIVEEISDEGW